jgi:hypothetical protein
MSIERTPPIGDHEEINNVSQKVHNRWLDPYSEVDDLFAHFQDGDDESVADRQRWNRRKAAKSHRRNRRIAEDEFGGHRRSQPYYRRKPAARFRYDEVIWEDEAD